MAHKFFEVENDNHVRIIQINRPDALNALNADLLSELAALIIDCQNHILCPGFIDLNANIGEPGEEFKENINTASDAALASGITSIVCMPNTNPVIDQIPIIQYIEKRARETNGVKIYPAASITKNLEGKQLTEMGLLLEAGAILFSEANNVISNTKVMKQALTYAKNFDATIMISPQDPDLSKN